MDDKKLIKLLAKEIQKERIIYDKKYDIPRYGNRNQLIKKAFEAVAINIKEKEDCYFWLRG